MLMRNSSVVVVFPFRFLQSPSLPMSPQLYGKKESCEWLREMESWHFADVEKIIFVPLLDEYTRLFDSFKNLSSRSLERIRFFSLTLYPTFIIRLFFSFFFFFYFHPAKVRWKSEFPHFTLCYRFFFYLAYHTQLRYSALLISIIFHICSWNFLIRNSAPHCSYFCS